MKIKDNIEIYDINCSILSKDNCAKSDDTIFSLCKLDNNVCIRDEDKHLNIDYIKSGNIANLKIDNISTNRQVKLIKYLTMNINLYENCEYKDEDSAFNELEANDNTRPSHTKVVNDIQDFINISIIKDSGEKLNSISNIVNFISHELLNINNHTLSEYIKSIVVENEDNEYSLRSEIINQDI